MAVRLAEAGAGPEVVCRPRPRRRLQGDVHGGRRAGSGKAAEAGADVIIAQGTEGGGHVGWMASMVLIADGRRCGRADPGADGGRRCRRARAGGGDRARRQGILLGTRFLASVESPLHPNFKQAIVDSDGHDTALSVIPISPPAGVARRDDALAAQPVHRAVGGPRMALRQAAGAGAVLRSRRRARRRRRTRRRCRWGRTPG